MSSFVFNTFKQRFLNGEVPSADTWNFTPMNKNFLQKFGKDDYPVEQFTSLEDFYRHDAYNFDKSYLSGLITTFDWYKPKDTDEITKPMFVTEGVFDEKGKVLKEPNWQKFKESYYYPDVSGNSAIPSYLASGGFYYIRTKSELRWFADRANSGNNRIIGVVGDGIDGVIHGQIGKDERYPFEGIFDGNGHALDNIQVMCDNTDNGLVGVLGREGTVRNFAIRNTKGVTNLVCKKKINLQYIKDDGRDINAGILVGRNYGKVENINAHALGTFKFSGFVPEVYSVTNKSDNYSDFSTIREKFDQGENYYHLNSFCINSPGNICPYVGYFAEGLFAQKASGVTEGKAMCIEANDARKAKFNTGMSEINIDMANAELLAAGLFIKSDIGCLQYPGLVWNSYMDRVDPWLFSFADKKYGKNAVAIWCVKYIDTFGMEQKVWIEMNGFAYDKKASKGERRYHFFPGHLDLGFDVQDDTLLDTTFEADNDQSIREWLDTNHKDWFNWQGDKKCFINFKYDNEEWDRIGESGGVFDNKGWGNIGAVVKHDAMGIFKRDAETYCINLQKTWDNGNADDSDDVDSIRYKCDPDDVQIFANDGTPGMVTNLNLDNMHWKPLNIDTSNAVWNSPVCFILNQINPIIYPLTDSAGNEMRDESGEVIMMTWPHTYAECRDDSEEAARKWDENDEVVYHEWTGNSMVHTVKHFTCMPDAAWKKVKNNFNDYYEFRYRVFKWNTVSNDDRDALDDRVEPKLSHKYGGDLLCRSDERDIFEPYFKTRTTRWFGRYSSGKYFGPSGAGITIYEDEENVDGNDTDGFYSYNSVTHRMHWMSDGAVEDITNGENIEGMTVDIGAFQYRPFLHGPFYPTDKFPTVNPGETISEISAATNDSEAAVNYLCSAAKLYALHPSYYGLDFEGNWTTQCVREDDYVEDLGTSDKEINYLNFNWNLMKKQWNDWDDNHCQERYDNADDTDTSDSLYGAADIPHALYNKPIRMHDMGRAAYYISPLVGANYGEIKNVIVSSTRTNDGNFVGFIGSVAGKQARGHVTSARVYAEDKLNYFEAKPAKPDYSKFTTNDLKIGDYDLTYQQALEDWSAATANYNYEVRYKTTPIIPLTVAGDTSVLNSDPTENKDEYKYYPSNLTVDDDDIHDGTVTLYATDLDTATATATYSYTAEAYRGETITIASYKQNPLYIQDEQFYKATKAIRAYCSAWYGDYEATAKNPMDDTITYKLKPIFNAGGLFGKLIPTYNNTTYAGVKGSSTTATSEVNHGTQIDYCDVVYNLNNKVPRNSVKHVHGNVSALDSNTNDIHNNFGSIAALLDVQTSEISPHLHAANEIKMFEINASGYGTGLASGDEILPIGFLSYKPTEINTVPATEGAGRGKGRCWVGIRQNTTYALDYPIMSNRGDYFEGTKDNMYYAPINQSPIAFWNSTSLKNKIDGNSELGPNKLKEYYNEMIRRLFTCSGHTVNLFTSSFTYCNPDAMKIRINKSNRGLLSINSVLDSNTTFTMPLFENSASESANYIESLTGIDNVTRRYEIKHDKLDLPSFAISGGVYTPHTIDYLSNTKIFNRPAIDDLYFSYSYTSAQKYSDDLTFKEKVEFTSAAKDAVNLKSSNQRYLNKNVNLGYVFRDDAKWEGDGFWYRNNFLHIGDSVSPNHIRTVLRNNKKLQTSAVSAVQWGHDTGELDELNHSIYTSSDKMFSASDSNQFGGLLVTDSNDRCVMWIENENGVKLENNPWNLELPHVTYHGHEGGLILAVKGSMF